MPEKNSKVNFKKTQRDKKRGEKDEEKMFSVCFVVSVTKQIFTKKKEERYENCSCNHNLSSLAILLAIFLKPIDVPDIRLNRTPFNDKRGNLHTSISHETTESVVASP